MYPDVFLLNLFQLLIPGVGRKIIKGFKDYKKTFKLIFVEEFFTFLGYATYIFALSTMPVLIMKSIDSVQPIYVMLIAVFSHKLLGLKLHENDHLKNIEKKLFWFVAIMAGIFLVVYFEK